ncbi:hypothetical protein, partial [Bifidobacterium xylocopae]
MRILVPQSRISAFRLFAVSGVVAGGLEPTGDHADDSEQAKSGKPASGHQKQPLSALQRGGPRQEIRHKQGAHLRTENEQAKTACEAMTPTQHGADAARQVGAR